MPFLRRWRNTRGNLIYDEPIEFNLERFPNAKATLWLILSSVRPIIWTISRVIEFIQLNFRDRKGTEGPRLISGGRFIDFARKQISACLAISCCSDKKRAENVSNRKLKNIFRIKLRKFIDSVESLTLSWIVLSSNMAALLVEIHSQRWQCLVYESQCAREYIFTKRVSGNIRTKSK